jgi:signal transduction histidine kinase/DNA-binding response OmpR family regulator
LAREFDGNGKTAGFLTGSGELGELMRTKDWSTSAVGPVETWPQSLKTVVRIMLDSRYQMWMGWGPELTFYYNDAYRPTLGAKHPWALGAPAREVWAEIWSEIGPRIDNVLRGGGATYEEDLLLMLERHGYPEETYHTFSYSPLPDDSAGIGGMLCVVVEDTERFIAERRLRVLREVAAAIATVRDPDDFFAALTGVLGTHQRDLPFTAIYLVSSNGAQAPRAAATGIARDHVAVPETIAIAPDSPWPIEKAHRELTSVLVEDLAAHFTALPTGAWDKPPRQGLVVPIAQQGQSQPGGFMLVGLNPYRPFDENYRGFIDLLAGQIAAGLADVRAYEEERKRAEALAEIDRAKTAFFSNASHEFRTPLTLMLSPLEDMLARAPEAPAIEAPRRELELIHRNGLRLLKLVNTLLDFSRIEAGRVEAVYEPVDLASYTAGIASTFRSAMARVGLRFEVECETLPETAFVDRDMWEKIVLNLVSNAFKYTLEGTVTVALGATPDRRHAALVVRDTGIGVPEEELPRLFERFHRVEGQRGRTHEGTGIGLALVQELVRLHGGTVRVESTLGRGSAFTVTIPLGSAHLPRERIGAARSQVSTGVRADAFVEEALRWLPSDTERNTSTLATELFGPAPMPETDGVRVRVVLADDNADMRIYVGRLLATRYEVEVVGDGEAALASIRRQRPDLVLADLMMPGLDGFGLLREIRDDPALRDLPVVFLSARAGEEARVEGLEAGADDYLTKPFSARELMARVAANIETARIRRRAVDLAREETRTLEILNETGAAVAAELDLDRLVQTVTDAAVELTGAHFGAFFYNVIDASGEAYTLYALSGVPREAFEKFPMPRNTAVFEPTFRGFGVVRSDNIREDARYGKSGPHFGMPRGHLPVCSYLAVPVVSRSGEVLGGLFFGHPEPAIFDERHERIVTGIAAQAAVAIDNARLYQASQRAERDLQLLNETLEQRVAERTAQLEAEVAERRRAEDALRQAQKMEAIGQLTGGVAHDFNNLLTVITGNLEALDRRLGDQSPELRRFGAAALRGATRAATLTHQLLAFARRQPLEPKPLEINRLVLGLSDLLRRTLGESIAIETVLAGGLWQSFADGNQLENALVNLAVNARDAMPDGGKLTIETANAYLDEAYAATHEEVTTGQYVLIAVTDTGSGMTKDVITKAFEPFFTTKGIGQGTGLGLSQVYGFIKQSGGHVKIYSEIGEGTTVRLYLPRYRAKDALTEAVATPEPVPTGTALETILVVEDDPDVRTYTVDILRELGYRVLEADDGSAALRVIAQHPEIGLLFTDVGLPGTMNGKQLSDAARRERPDLKVLFTTGYARNAIVHQGRLDEGVELIVKPFTYAGLASKIRQVLEAD